MLGFCEKSGFNVKGFVVRTLGTGRIYAIGSMKILWHISGAVSKVSETENMVKPFINVFRKPVLAL